MPKWTLQATQRPTSGLLTSNCRYNAKTDTATNFPNKIGFPISLHHGRNHNGALDFR